MESAGFERDVLKALRPLPRLSLGMVPLGQVQGSAFECIWNGTVKGPFNNGTVFVQASASVSQHQGHTSRAHRLSQDMLSAVPDLYGAADNIWVHPYPACGDNPWDDWCAQGWLAAYRDIQAAANVSWHTDPAHTDTLPPVLVTETGWQAPQNESGKALWIVQAFQQLWLPDETVIGVMPFLLAGQFWIPRGWPWTLWDEDGDGILETVQPQYLALQALVQGLA